MHSGGGDAGSGGGASALRRFLPITLLMPVLGSALGIDGGAMFQIIASEDLGLGSTAIGIAFGMGVLSLPVQIWAARMPLSRARRNLQAFLLIAAVEAWLLAGLVAAGAGGSRAGAALALTVLAEIALSVLYATALQPLLSAALTSVQRQRLNARGRAMGGVLLALSLLMFASVDRGARVAFLVAVGLAAAWSAVGLRHLVPTAEVAVAPAADGGRPRLPADVRALFLVFSITGLGAWPLLLLYVHDVLWPRANLGLIGALQLGGSLAASMSWRPTAGRVVARAAASAGVLLAAGVALALLRAPLQHHGEQLALLVTVVVAAAATTVMRIALMELMHRSVDGSISVRAFTLLDVVASTSVQVGLLLAGLLVAACTHTTSWPIDPYAGYIVVCAVLAVIVIARLQSREDRVLGT
jgi:hypothetical protein